MEGTSNIDPYPLMKDGIYTWVVLTEIFLKKSFWKLTSDSKTDWWITTLKEMFEVRTTFCLQLRVSIGNIKMKYFKVNNNALGNETWMRDQTTITNETWLVWLNSCLNWWCLQMLLLQPKSLACLPFTAF